MALHLVALAKLNLIFTSHSFGPLLASLIWPFLLKLSFGFRQARQTYIDVVYASSLFFFQLRQIAMEDYDQQASSSSRGGIGGSGSNNNSRWERAIRLVYRRLTNVRRPVSQQEDEESLHTLSMLAL